MGGFSGYPASPGEVPAYAGTDFIIARDGKITALYLFFDKFFDKRERNFAITESK